MFPSSKMGATWLVSAHPVMGRAGKVTQVDARGMWTDLTSGDFEDSCSEEFTYSKAGIKYQTTEDIHPRTLRSS